MKRSTAATVIAGEAADDHEVVREDATGPPPKISKPNDDSSSNSTLMSFDRANRNRPAQHTIPENVIRTFVSNYTGPHPNHENTYIVMNPDVINTFGGSLYDQILNNLYPDGDYFANGLITRGDFQLVCRYVLKSRIDNVYSKISGRRPADRVPPVTIAIPQSLATVVNGVGSFLALNGALFCIPQPPDPPVDQGNRIINLITHRILNDFSRLITTASQRGMINLSQMAFVPEGTAYWLLTARETVNRAIVADGASVNVKVWAQFSEWTPADGILAAVVVNRFAGNIIVDSNDLFFSMPSINDAVGLRTMFSTLA